MITSIKNRVQLFWSAGSDARSLTVKKNIAYTFFIKGGSVLIGLMLVPMTIHYINPAQYGIWLTVSSLVAWMNNFDIGLSHGLRNKLAHSLALGELDNIRRYVSTTYVMLLLISLVTFLVFLIGGAFFNWNNLLNINVSIYDNVWPIILITLSSFCIQFALQPINTILIATHQPFKSSLLLFLGQLITLIGVYLLTRTMQANLLTLVIVMSGSPILVLLIANIYLFATSLKDFAPKINFIHFKSAKGLLQVGSVFFFIQLGALILFETDNIVVTKTLGPQAVTTFNIAFKCFSILAVSFSVIMTPYWSAFTDAFAKNDMDWIKQSINKMDKIWLCFSVMSIILYLISHTIYKLWIGSVVNIPSSLSLSMAVYVMAVTRQLIYAYALNGIGKLKIQLICIVISGIVNIPLSVLLINKVGVCGTVIANIIVMAIMSTIFTYQINLIINNKAGGIWNK